MKEEDFTVKVYNKEYHYNKYQEVKSILINSQLNLWEIIGLLGEMQSEVLDYMKSLQENEDDD